MKQSRCLLCAAKTVTGQGKSRHYQTIKLDPRSTSRGMKSYSESRIQELQNLQILKKLLEKLSRFLSSEQPCEPKSLYVAFNIPGIENRLEKLAVLVNLEVMRFEFLMKLTLVRVEICVIYGW